VTVDSFTDTAYDELSTIRNKWQLIFEDPTISRTRRNTVMGVMGRLSVTMEICINLGKMADTLDEEAYNITPSVEASEICELSCRYLPNEH